ncbi:MAG: hypothetical protein NZM11_10985 [Anaerolineales bacterium]|nr:hypothetical protein [Anaerolineales bacterium]
MTTKPGSRSSSSPSWSSPGDGWRVLAQKVNHHVGVHQHHALAPALGLGAQLASIGRAVLNIPAVFPQPNQPGAAELAGRQRTASRFSGRPGQQNHFNLLALLIG